MEDPQLWLEAFAILNIGFLTFDIYLAHSVNPVSQPAEYIPLLFSAIAPVVLLFALCFRKRRPVVWKILGHVVGWVGDSGWPYRGDSAPREPLLLRAHVAQLDLLSALRRAPGLHRAWLSAGHESHGRCRISGVGVWVLLMHAGRLHWQFRLQSRRSCCQRLLLSSWSGCRWGRARSPSDFSPFLC